MAVTQQFPRIGVGIFVWKDGKFIVGKRIGAHGENSWSIPGGHLDFGESWEACAARETLEETGVKIKNICFLTATNDIFQEENKHYVTIWMESDWESGEAQVTEPDKFIDIQWCDFKTLPQPLFQTWKQLKIMRPDLFNQ